jgi:hypothetical protein
MVNHTHRAQIKEQKNIASFNLSEIQEKTIKCEVDHHIDKNNSTVNKLDGPLLWDEKQQTMFLAGYYYGYAASQVEILKMENNRC